MSPKRFDKNAFGEILKESAGVPPEGVCTQAFAIPCTVFCVTAPPSDTYVEVLPTLTLVPPDPALSTMVSTFNCEPILYSNIH